MEIKDMMKMVESQIDQQFSGAYTLGDLITALQSAPEDECVRFDFGGFTPTGFDSYRGYYRFLALDYKEIHWNERSTVKQFLKECEETNGKTFTGYKGGDFTMDLKTPIWLAHYSETTNTMISHAKMEPDGFIIHTKYVAD